MCDIGYYLNSSNKCSKCTISNCARCDKNGTCLACNSDYYLSDDKKSCLPNDGKFNCSDSNFMRIGNLCITRKNMGDSTTLKIPSSVITVEASGDYCYSQTEKCCWKGTTSNSCDSVNGNYSGCNRTVCNYSAAQEICAKFNYAGKTWRLATKQEADTWGDFNFNFLNNGLMLCGAAANTGIYTRCDFNYNCKGANSSNKCIAHYTWLADLSGLTKAYYLTNYYGNISISATSYLDSASVRCVTEMDTE